MRFSRKLSFAPMATIVLLFVLLYVQCSPASDDLSYEQKNLARNAFNMFDREKKGYIDISMISHILRTMGQAFVDKDLKDLIKDIDANGNSKLEFDEYLALTARFVVDDDTDVIQKELREAFRLYDKEGNGYIKTSDLREIIRALDDKLTEDELHEMIGEIDTDGSGTVDFDEFMEMMAGD